METFEEKFSVCTNGTAIEENVFLYDGVRITVLTSELIRMDGRRTANSVIFQLRRSGSDRLKRLIALPKM